MSGYIPLSLIVSPAGPFAADRPPFGNSLEFVVARLWPRLRRARRAAPQPETTPSCHCEPCPPVAIPVTR